MPGRALAENRGGLGGGEIAWPLPAGDTGSDLNGGDAGDIERMPGLGPDQGAYPGAASLLHMTLDEGGGIEEVIRHRQRRSRMIVSERGSPLISTS